MVVNKDKLFDIDENSVGDADGRWESLTRETQGMESGRKKGE